PSNDLNAGVYTKCSHHKKPAFNNTITRRKSMENIKTAAPYSFVEKLVEGDIGYIVTPQLEALTPAGDEVSTSYVLVSQDDHGTFVWPANYMGEIIGRVAHIEF